MEKAETNYKKIRNRIREEKYSSNAVFFLAEFAQKFVLAVDTKFICGMNIKDVHGREFMRIREERVLK